MVLALSSNVGDARSPNRPSSPGIRWLLIVGTLVLAMIGIGATGAAAATPDPRAQVVAPAQPTPPPAPAPTPEPEPPGGGDPTAEPPDPPSDTPAPTASRPTTSRPTPLPPSNQLAEQQAQLLAEQREALLDAQEQAREAQAELASASQRARESWEERGRPNQLIIVRSETVDAVSDGVLTGRAPRPAGVLTLAALDGVVPGPWVTIDTDVARLSATLVLTTGVVMDVGGDVRTLELTGGATAPEAASIYTGSGRLVLHELTVTSRDPNSDRAVPPAAGRPVVEASSGGQLLATDVTFSDLGTPATDPGEQAGVQFNENSSGSLVRTSLLRGTTGLRLDRSVDVRLEAVTVDESAAEGLVLSGDRGTTLVGVKAERNRGNGVLVDGPSTDRPVTGLSTAGNGQYGIAVVGQTAPRIADVTTQADAVGGLRISRSTEARVTGFTAVDQPVGVFTHVNSSGLVLDRMRIVGGRDGIRLEKTTKGVELTASTIERTDLGVSIGGHDTALRDLTMTDSSTGVKVQRGAGEVTAVGVTLSGGDDGFVALSGTTGVVVTDLAADGVGGVAVRNFSRDARITGGKITGSTTGIDVGAATTISGTAVSGADVGIRVRSPEPAAAERVDVSAVTFGVEVAPGSRFVLADSRVDALEAVHGEVELRGANELSLPPLRLIGVIGVPLIILAFALEMVHSLRQRVFARGGRRAPAPAAGAAGVAPAAPSRVALPELRPRGPAGAVGKSTLLSPITVRTAMPTGRHASGPASRHAPARSRHHPETVRLRHVRRPAMAEATPHARVP